MGGAVIPTVQAIRYITAPLAGARRTRLAFVGWLVVTPAGERLIKAPGWGTYRATADGLRQLPASNPCTLNQPNKEKNDGHGPQ